MRAAATITSASTRIMVASRWRVSSNVPLGGIGWARIDDAAQRRYAAGSPPDAGHVRASMSYWRNPVRGNGRSSVLYPRKSCGRGGARRELGHERPVRHLSEPSVTVVGQVFGRLEH
ncbi:hypothetical protein ABT294_45440 [Nonomuraea sp. NPDC000554]|uniref:hypothetical protein n=1 Tax=Nonomuraea sp. NPDC000554 TaxID=3154259 RepID=UPI00332CE232